MYKVYWIKLEDHINISEEGYVGITKHFYRRMTEHKSQNKGYHLHLAIKKYGWDLLEKHIIAYFDTEKEALALESVLRPTGNIGWNTLAGGGNGNNHTKETKAKISNSMKGNKNSNGFDDSTLVCPFCGKEGQKAAMLRWHFDSCNKRK